MASAVNAGDFLSRGAVMDSTTVSTLVMELGRLPRLAAMVTPAAWTRLIAKVGVGVTQVDPVG